MLKFKLGKNNESLILSLKEINTALVSLKILLETKISNLNELG